VRDGPVQHIPEARLGRCMHVHGRRHTWSAVGIDLEVGTCGTRARDFAAIEGEIQAAGRACRTRLDDGRRHRLPLRTGKCGARHSGYVDIALAGDIPAQGRRADKVHADKIRAKGVMQSFRYVITEHGDFGPEHPATIRHPRARLTAHARPSAGTARPSEQNSLNCPSQSASLGRVGPRRRRGFAQVREGRDYFRCRDCCRSVLGSPSSWLPHDRVASTAKALAGPAPLDPVGGMRVRAATR
jgi:hypothetical protein